MFLFPFIQILNKKMRFTSSLLSYCLQNKNTLPFEWNHKIFACIEFPLVVDQIDNRQNDKSNKFQVVILNGTGLKRLLLLISGLGLTQKCDTVLTFFSNFFLQCLI